MVLLAFALWWVAANVFWWLCWWGGVNFTVRLSLSANLQCMQRIIRAPCDRFFDRTPVGRIMNRLSTDLQNIDIQAYNQISQSIACGWGVLVPLVYVHVIMPLYFTFITLPIYALLLMVVRRYWNTFVPLRYLTHVSKSETDSTLTDVEHSNSFVRALQKGKFRFDEFQIKICNQIKADVATTVFCKRWVIMRLYLILAWYVCLMVIIMIWVPNACSFGAVGLCLANLLRIAMGIENDVEIATNSQFQFISMNRVHEYTKLPQEAALELPGDAHYKSFTLTLWRSRLGKLEIAKDANGNTETPIRIVKTTVGREVTVLEEYAAGGKSSVASFVPSKFVAFQDLDPKTPELSQATSWHRLVGVNAAKGTADSIAHELCSGSHGQVKLNIQSGWLLDGAHVVIEDLVVGYGDIPRDILKSVSLEITPRTHVGVVGTTGCGKSTLLLSLLRILEPRKGRILLDGVNTQDVGLGLLRSTLGLVPQDPVLFQCSLRDNLDPFHEYDDDHIFEALRVVQLDEAVKELENGIHYYLQAGSTNLSFGQRQLLCLCRIVVKQSKLILLDEATSALDPSTQELVQKTIETRFPDSTLVVIAHRLETILDFDMIVVMDEGRIVEKGPVQALKNIKGGIFARMLAAKTTW